MKELVRFNVLLRIQGAERGCGGEEKDVEMEGQAHNRKKPSFTFRHSLVPLLPFFFFYLHLQTETEI